MGWHKDRLKAQRVPPLEAPDKKKEAPKKKAATKKKAAPKKKASK